MWWFSKLVRRWYEYLENGKGNTIKHSVMEKLEKFKCDLGAERIQGRAFTFQFPHNGRMALMMTPPSVE